MWKIHMEVALERVLPDGTKCGINVTGEKPGHFPYFLLFRVIARWKMVEKLTSPQIVFINRAKFCFFTDPLPIVTNDCLDPVNYSDSCLPGMQEMMRGNWQEFQEKFT